MELPRPDSTPSTSTEQEDSPLRNTDTARNSATTRAKPFLCFQMKLPVALDFSAACFAALAAFSMVAEMLWPDLTEAAYCFLMARFCCHREMGLLVSWGLSRICF